MAIIFISHRSFDAAVAEKLAIEIRSKGHDVWLDAWEIDLGDSIVEKMAEGLSKAAFVVVCYSTQGIDSKWMSREWMSTLARQLDEIDVVLLPVKLPGTKGPAILSDLKYADLERDWDEGVRQILKRIEK